MNEQLSLLETRIADLDLFGNPIIIDIKKDIEDSTFKKGRNYNGQDLIPGLEGPLFSYIQEMNSRIN